MKLFAKITAGTLLGFGLLVGVGTAVDLTNPNSTPHDRQGAVAALLVFGAPCTTIGGAMFWDARRKYQRNQRDRLRSAFFKLLQENEGHITPLRFAMELGLDGTEAKAYLDERAKEFDAQFNVTDDGNLVYYFELGGSNLDRR